MSVLADAAHLLETGEPMAIATVVGKEGSAPRDVGARLVVTEADTYGTLGGGTVEGLVVEAAREVLAGSQEPGIRTYELTKDGNTGMVCGGTMDVFIDTPEQRPRLYIAGGGYIGRELATIAARLDFDVTVIDDRDEYADPETFPDEIEVVRGRYDEVLRDRSITGNTAVAVATRNQTFDAQAVAAALDGGAGYVGLVASGEKTEHVLDGLREDGYSPSELARVRGPIGLDLGGETPGEIALSILAEINAVRYDTSAEPMTRTNFDDLVVVRGGGGQGSGVVYRLHQAGFPVVVADVDRPTVVRRAVAFASARYEGTVDVEGVTARKADSVDEAVLALEDGEVPVLDDPDADVATELDADVLVDAIMAKGKYDTGTRRDDADVVIGLGPGFEAGADVDAVVETNRGHELGRAIYDGTADEYDGEPGERRGYTHERVLRAPSAGTWESSREIAEMVESGDVIGHVDDDPVVTEIDGLIRGLVHDGVAVDEGAKLGDVDPRGESVDPAKISDKALAVGSGALEAVLRLS